MTRKLYLKSKGREIMRMRMFKLVLCVVIGLILIAGCSQNEASDQDNKDENEQSEEQKNNESTDGDNNEADDDTEENQSPAEDQLGLKLGETGVVENSNGKYEVMVNSVRYVNTIGDNVEPESEVFVIADVSIKN